MSIAFSVYVGPYLKCTAKKENLEYFWDIMGNELSYKLEEILPECRVIYYLIPNIKVKGILRRTKFRDYDDSLKVVPFNYLTVESEVHNFSVQFAEK